MKIHVYDHNSWQGRVVPVDSAVERMLERRHIEDALKDTGQLLGGLIQLLNDKGILNNLEVVTLLAAYTDGDLTVREAREGDDE